ncbi:hypothetical protein COD78_24490 [Bacillus cereus]|uniref:hypothetical protein n=1 Tax=Bacillus cereus TaxID=1396 RepID=UPI00019FDC77|nr:hypothetical protein [Bacillus cereus]EEK58983.1 hypothetical protein bcere0005_53650 [Bacillus cereus 172560W]MBJ8089232.1 hypothetical protein [Bacillus cereus]MCU4885104.1 hypothetical protein [Bacillus cereus]PFC79955.1 hypothetical protein CN298_16075 [Bacillus cereus]PFN58285.1 hypothetical protein COJ73_00345 [Bacillus cereus]
MSNDNHEKKYTSDPCTIGLGVALKDKKVIKAINQKIQRQHVFIGYKCEGITIPEVVKVHLDFDCKPGEQCIIDPSLYITVNLISLKVEEIEGEDT